MIDKAMWEVNNDDAALEAFREDAGSFLDRWQASVSDPKPPHPWGGTLTPEERAALVAWDYERLYALGAHPFLLWQFTRSLYVPDRMTDGELVEAFRVAAARHGYPDFAT